MAAILRDGPLDWRLQRDDQGYRTYRLRLLVEVTSPRDGPAVASNAAGLPLPGQPWIIDNEVDIWVWCRSEASVTPLVTEEPNQFFILEYTFSNKPLPSQSGRGGNRPARRLCHEQQIEDPLLEPPHVSGGFLKQKKEATHDRFGEPILTSSHEVMRGPQVEFDESRPTVKVVMNVVLLRLPLLCVLIDCLNDAPLWGFPARWVRFANCTWDQQFHGFCYAYIVLTLEFEIREDWDRDILDEGTKVLKGHWGDGGQEGSGWVLDKIDGADPNPSNPGHFIKAVDRHDNPMRVILDGAGKPATSQGIPIASLSLSGTTLTVVTELAHGLEAGDRLTIVGADPPYYDGEYTALTGAGTTFAVTWNDIENPSPYTDGGHVFVEGTGPGSRHVEKYRSANLLQLGIPVTLPN